MYRKEPRLIVENGEQENSFTNFTLMEDILEKLKILNYEHELVKNLKMKPLNRHYFVVTKNPGEQFFMFTTLTAWLFRKIGKHFEDPQEYDDPNTTISSILETVRSIGVTVDFPANKLKQGVGEHVIYVLDQLTNEALKKNNFIWKRPELIKEAEPETETIEDESELILDRVEEEMAAAYSDESDDDNLLHVDDLNLSQNTSDNIRNAEQQQILLSNIDSESWKLELERVLPQLKVTIKTDGRDWRAHLEQMKSHRSGIEYALTSTKQQLDKLHNDISFTMDKIVSREKYINSHLENLISRYRVLKDEVTKVNDQYKSVSGGVTERTRELSRITDQLETIKQQMDERGSSMTDGTPLINIKKAISNVKGEIKEMDIRIGVLQCILIQAKIRDNKILQQKLESPLSSHPVSLVNVIN